MFVIYKRWINQIIIKKNREHIRNKYHNMTDEERQKYKEYQKNYRKNMTDEQKQRYREAKKKHY